MSQRFPLKPVGRSAWLFMVGMAVICLIIAISLGLAPPLTSPASWVMGGSIVLCVGLAALFLWFAVGQGRSSLEITTHEVRFNAPIYGRVIQRDRLITAEIEIVEWAKNERYRLKWRTNGLGVPGYLLGWFRSRQGQTILAALSSPQALAIPTEDQYTLLVSVADPEAVRQTLQLGANV